MSQNEPGGPSEPRPSLDGCEEYFDDDEQKYYYYNPRTDETSWIHPKFQKQESTPRVEEEKHQQPTAPIPPSLPPISKIPHLSQEVTDEEPPQENTSPKPHQRDSYSNIAPIPETQYENYPIVHPPLVTAIPSAPQFETEPNVYKPVAPPLAEPTRVSRPKTDTFVSKETNIFVPEAPAEPTPSIWKNWFRKPRDKVEINIIIYVCAQVYHIIFLILSGIYLPITVAPEYCIWFMILMFIYAGLSITCIVYKDSLNFTLVHTICLVPAMILCFLIGLGGAISFGYFSNIMVVPPGHISSNVAGMLIIVCSINMFILIVIGIILMVLHSGVPEKERIVHRVTACDHFPFCFGNPGTTKTLLTMCAIYSLLAELVIDYWYAFFLIKQNTSLVYGFIMVCLTGMVAPVVTLFRIFLPPNVYVSMVVSFCQSMSMFVGIIFMFVHINALAAGVGVDLLYGHILMICFPLLIGNVIKVLLYISGVVDMMCLGEKS